VWMRAWRLRWLGLVKDLPQWQLYLWPLPPAPAADVAAAVAPAADGAVLEDDGAETVEA
jgi:hypothetical protein